jgi:hypothetical protein
MPHPARKIRRSQRLAKRTPLKGGRASAQEEGKANPAKEQPQRDKEKNTQMY